LSLFAVEEPKPLEKSQAGLWKLLLRLAMFGVVLWFIAAHLDFRQIRDVFFHLRPGYLIPILTVLMPLAILLRGAKWRYLFSDQDRLPLRVYLRAYITGVLANAVLLSKFGDLVKARSICGSRVGYGQSLALVAIDRLLEGLCLLMIFAVAILNSSLPRWAYELALVAGLSSLGTLGILRVMVHKREPVLAMAHKSLARIPLDIGKRLLGLLDCVLTGCEVLANHRRVTGSLLYALAVWAVDITTVVFFLAAFSVPAPHVVSAVTLLVVLNFGILVPISPGSVGVYQLLCAAALALWGVDRQLGFAVGVAMQTVLFVPLYLVGLVLILAPKWTAATGYSSSAVVE